MVAAPVEPQEGEKHVSGEGSKSSRIAGGVWPLDFKARVISIKSSIHCWMAGWIRRTPKSSLRRLHI